MRGCSQRYPICPRGVHECVLMMFSWYWLGLSLIESHSGVQASPEL